MEKITHCPLCNAEGFTPFLQVKDYFLSHQDFTITQCTKCNFKFTNPRPDRYEINTYYESPDYISHDAGKGTLFESIYKAARNYMLRKKLKLVKQNTSGLRILDIGCATGEFLNQCIQSGFQPTGIEPNEKARNFSSAQYGLSVYPEEELNLFSPATFDIVTLWHVLEHIHTLNERMKQIHRLLTSNGTLIIAVPNCDSMDASIYKEYWAAYDVPRHLYHFNRQTMKLFIEKHGFTLHSILPMKLDSYYVSLLSEKYKSGGKNYIAALLNGARSNFSAKKDNLNNSSLIYICKKANN